MNCCEILQDVSDQHVGGLIAAGHGDRSFEAKIHHRWSDIPSVWKPMI